jgi:hypothetical protein
MNDSSTYSSKADVIDRVILPALTGHASSPDEYDIDGIYDQCFGWVDGRLTQTVDTDGFWQAVEKHAK